MTYSQNVDTVYDVIVIGGGQAGLATGYFLEKTNLNYVILDNQEQPGGAWQHTWDSLHLFSPARWSSLPGNIMKGGRDYYPHRNEVIEYLNDYEDRNDLHIHRPINVRTVLKMNNHFNLETSKGIYQCQKLVSATGTWQNPYIPDYPGKNKFKGEQIHSAFYKNPMWFAGKKVAIVGGGNSGAQILAEVSQVAEDSLWITQKEPQFLPDDIDGRYLFNRATQIYQGRKQQSDFFSLGDIVVVPSVKEARRRGVMKRVSPFKNFTKKGIIWSDGTYQKVDTVIWCTGFKPALHHLHNLNIFNDKGRIPVQNCQSIEEPGLWLVGYGNWTGYASATLIGVGRYAYNVINDINSSFSK